MVREWGVKEEERTTECTKQESRQEMNQRDHQKANEIWGGDE